MSILNARCKNCNETMKRLVLKAMLEDGGAECYPSSAYCSPGLEHRFVEPDKASGSEVA